jgi:NDP-sugar pyrophosphorylase family protein
LLVRGNMEDVMVVVLAGGKGVRLRPYTTVLPKPLLPVGDIPILEVALRQLKSYGFKRVVLSVNHLAKLIQAFFADGSNLGLDISYCLENEPLGTAGCISLVENLSDTFLVMNGDLLTTLNYAALVRAHIESSASATIGAFPREVAIDFGVLELDDNGELLAYKEKPKLEYIVSMGVNVFDKSACEFISHGQYLDIPTLMIRLKDAGKRVMTYRSDCEWLDIGRQEDYELAVVEFERSRGKYLKEKP